MKLSNLVLQDFPEDVKAGLKGTVAIARKISWVTHSDTSFKLLSTLPTPAILPLSPGGVYNSDRGSPKGLAGAGSNDDTGENTLCITLPILPFRFRQTAVTVGFQICGSGSCVVFAEPKTGTEPVAKLGYWSTKFITSGTAIFFQACNIFHFRLGMAGKHGIPGGWNETWPEVGRLRVCHQWSDLENCWRPFISFTTFSISVNNSEWIYWIDRNQQLVGRPRCKRINSFGLHICRFAICRRVYVWSKDRLHLGEGTTFCEETSLDFELVRWEEYRLKLTSERDAKARLKDIWKAEE